MEIVAQLTFGDHERDQTTLKQTSTPRRRRRQKNFILFFVNERLGPALTKSLALWIIYNLVIILMLDEKSSWVINVRYALPFLLPPILLLTYPRPKKAVVGILHRGKKGAVAILQLQGVALSEILRYITGLKSYRLMDHPSVDSDGRIQEYRIYHSIWSAWLFARIASKGRKPVHHPPHRPGHRFHFHTFGHGADGQRGSRNIHFLYGDPVRDENQFELVPNQAGGEKRYWYKNQTGSWKFMPRLPFDF